MSQATEWWATIAARQGLSLLDQHVRCPEDWQAAERTGAEDFARAVREIDLPRGSDLRILEIGCGAGRMTSTLARHYGFVEALDVSLEYLRRAERHCPAEHVRFRAISGDSLHVPEHDAYDVVFSYEVFHYLEPLVLRQYLHDSHAALKPGGTLAVQLNTQPLGWRTRLSRLVRRTLWMLGVEQWRGWPTAPAFCHKTYEVSWLLATLEQSGFAACQAIQPETRRSWLVARKPGLAH